MSFFYMACQSVIFGLVAILFWVVIWGAVFPETWVGYHNHTMRVFWLSSLAYLAFGTWAIRSRRR